ncbi:MAG TPA: hypothetical protein VGK67_35325 [Myxococcales bacterium]|jgi:hypothetical protein
MTATAKKTKPARRNLRRLRTDLRKLAEQLRHVANLAEGAAVGNDPAQGTVYVSLLGGDVREFLRGHAGR